MYYPSTQHDDYYGDEGWGLGAYAGDADDPVGQHAGTHLGQQATDSSGKSYFVFYDNTYKIPIAVPFNQVAYDKYLSKMRAMGRTPINWTGLVQFHNGYWGWIDKNTPGSIRVHQELTDPETHVKGAREDKYYRHVESEDLVDNNWDERHPRPPRQPRPAGGGGRPAMGGGRGGARAPQGRREEGRPAGGGGAAGPAAGGQPGRATRGRGVPGAPSNMGNRPPAPPPPPAAARPQPIPAPEPARRAGNYADAARQAPAPAAAAPAAARAAAGKPQGPQPTYTGAITKQGVPLLHLPNNGRRWDDNEREEFRKWAADFIANFKRTGETNKDIPKALSLSETDREDIKKQKKAYKDYWRWKNPDKVYPDAPKYSPAPRPPLPSQVAGKPPALGQQAPKPTHRALELARNLANMFKQYMDQGKYVDQALLSTLKSGNFGTAFRNFVKEMAYKQGVFRGLSTEPRYGAHVSLLKRYISSSPGNDMSYLVSMEYSSEQKFILSLFNALDTETAEGFFNFYKEDLIKSTVILSCYTFFHEISLQLQSLMDQAAKMGAAAQKEKVAMDAVKKVLTTEGNTNAKPENMFEAFKEMSERISSGIYAATNNENALKVQLVGGLMANQIPTDDPAKALYFLLQKMIFLITLPDFKKMVTVTDLFKESLEMYKEVIRPQAAGGDRGASGPLVRQPILPSVPDLHPYTPEEWGGAMPGAVGGATRVPWGARPGPSAVEVEDTRDFLDPRSQRISDEEWKGAEVNDDIMRRTTGRTHLVDLKPGGGSNFARPNPFSALDPYSGADEGALPQRRRKERRVPAAYSGPPEEDPVNIMIKDLEDEAPADRGSVSGGAAAAIEESAAEERGASAAGSARSGRQPSASAGGATSRARSASRGRSESAGQAAGADAAMPEKSEVATTRAKTASATNAVEKYNAWLLENPDAAFTERSKMRVYFASLESNLTPEEFHAMCDKAEQSLKFKQLSEKYEGYD